MRRALGMLVLLVAATGAGCLATDPAARAPECDDEVGPAFRLGCEMPAFTLEDDANQTRNGSSMDANHSRWVAYVSASWCTHCKPTFDALDQALPHDQLLIFNKDARERYSNMTEWHETMEEEVNRSVDRPFIHAPELAIDLEVDGIPHLVLVENGTVLAVRVGLWDDADDIRRWFESAAPESGSSPELTA